MLDEGEKTPEPLQQMPTSPPPSITTHSYTATSCVYPSPGPLSKRRSGRSEDITRLSIGNRPEFYTDITVSPPTPGEWRRSLHACHVYMEPCRVYMELLQFLNVVRLDKKGVMILEVIAVFLIRRFQCTCLYMCMCTDTLVCVRYSFSLSPSPFLYRSGRCTGQRPK